MTNAIYSTGYQYIGLNSAIWQNLCSSVNSYLTNMSAPTFTCNSTDNINSLMFSSGSSCYSLNQMKITLKMQTEVGAMNFHLLASNLQFVGQDNTPTTGCFLAFQDLGPSYTSILLGNMFMKQFVTVFNNDNSTIGLGVGNFGINFIATNGPWINQQDAWPAPAPPAPIPSYTGVLIILGGTVGVVILGCVGYCCIRRWRIKRL
jgi:hypothetical protein